LNEIWLVRHGETEWTLSKKHTSRTDLELTAAGEDDARALAPVLAEHSFAAVFTSPRKRAHRTAELAGIPDAAVDDDLVEVDYGEYEGRTTAEIRAERPDWDLFTDGTPGGESLSDAAARCQRLFEDIGPESGEGDVLLFAHGHILRVLAVTYLGLPPDQARCLALDVASVSLLGHEHWWRVVRVWNSTT
jgi:probable phosphoglycerate mutase